MDWVTEITGIGASAVAVIGVVWKMILSNKKDAAETAKDLYTQLAKSKDDMHAIEIGLIEQVGAHNSLEAKVDGAALAMTTGFLELGKKLDDMVNSQKEFNTIVLENKSKINHQDSEIAYIKQRK